MYHTWEEWKRKSYDFLTDEEIMFNYYQHALIH
jgi:hypothetical protein